MIKQPPNLKKGDRVAIVCPAKSLPSSCIDEAVLILESWGLEVIKGETVNASFHQFAGNDELRAKDLQRFLDDSSIKAIIAGRGGYGVIRIIDEVDFTNFCQNPKWLVGFSDITVLLSHIYANFGLSSIHGQMPYTFKESTQEALNSLKRALFGQQETISYWSTFKNKPGLASGVLIGGNLTLLVAMQGSISEMDFKDKILFIEDVGEHEYAIDRMLRNLDRAGKLKHLRGLIVGSFSQILPEKIFFGQTPEKVVEKIMDKYDFPICYQFPTGHINDNRALILGRKVHLNIQNFYINFKYL